MKIYVNNIHKKHKTLHVTALFTCLNLCHSPQSHFVASRVSEFMEAYVSLPEWSYYSLYC